MTMNVRMTFSMDRETERKLRNQANRAGRGNFSATLRECVDTRQDLLDAARELPDRQAESVRVVLLPEGTPVPMGAPMLRMRIPLPYSRPDQAGATEQPGPAPVAAEFIPPLSEPVPEPDETPPARKAPAGLHYAVNQDLPTDEDGNPDLTGGLVTACGYTVDPSRATRENLDAVTCRACIPLLEQDAQALIDHLALSADPADRERSRELLQERGARRRARLVKGLPA